MPPTGSSSLITRHLDHLKQSQRYSATTLEITARWLELFAAFWEDKGLETLSVEELTHWRQHLSWNPNRVGKIYAENTVNQAVGVVRGFYAWMLEEGLISTDPTTHLKTRRVPRRGRQLTMAERRKLLREPDLDTPLGIRARALLALILETGISRRACSRLDCQHVQLDTGALLAHGRKREVHSLSEGLVADLQRYLDFARPLLAAKAEPCEAFFLDRFGRRLSSGGIQQILRGHARRAGLSIP